MTFRQTVVPIIPRPARIAATTIFVCSALIGPVAGYIEQIIGNGWVPFHGVPLPVLGTLIGLAMGLFIGGIFAALVLSYGYVYGDARRRNMPAVPWTFVVIFVPNLLGFLLYFVLRKPLAGPCPQCGQPITPEQRFCSWCGWQRYPVAYAAPTTPSSSASL